MAMETKFLCQTYVTNSAGQPIIEETFECRSELAAEMRAEKLWETGRYEGVDAVVVSADPDEGEYDEPKFLIRLGNVPEYE